MAGTSWPELSKKVLEKFVQTETERLERNARTWQLLKRQQECREAVEKLRAFVKDLQQSVPADLHKDVKVVVRKDVGDLLASAGWPRQWRVRYGGEPFVPEVTYTRPRRAGEPIEHCYGIPVVVDAGLALEMKGVWESYAVAGELRRDA